MPSPSKFLLAAAMLSVALYSFAQPVNDDCSGAVQLSVGANTTCDNATAGTTEGAGFSGIDYCNAPVKDVWYSFVATASAHTLSVAHADYVNGGFDAYFFVEIFSGDCSGLNHLFCTSWLYSQGDIRFGDLVPGNTYFIRVANPYNESIEFDVCLSTPPAPPANDACSGAVALAVDPDAACDAATAGTTQGAATSPVPVCNDCYWAYDDVWYSFTATQYVHVLNLTDIEQANNPGASQYLSVNVFSGACGNLSFYNNAFFYANGTLVMSSLTPGQTYYVRVFSNINDPAPVNFNICVSSPPPPANDECANATAVIANPTPGDAEVFSGSVYASTPSETNCQGAAVNDVWYQFTATSPTHRIVLAPGYNYLFGFELYSGDCAGLVSLGCDDDYDLSRVITNLTVGETYYLRIFSPTFVQFDFYCYIVTLPFPPANDECAGALSLQVNADLSCNLQTNGSTLGATTSEQNCAGTLNTHDVWYSFVATNTSHRLEVNLLNTQFGNYFGLGYEVYGGDCNNRVSLLCQTYNNGYFPAILSGLTPGDTYYIRVYSNDQSAHDFSVCLQTLPPPPANATCTSATTLIPSPTPACVAPTAGTTAGAVSETLTNCYYNSGMDVWFAFTATGNAHIVRITDVLPLYGFYEYWAEIYAGDDCGNLTYLECHLYPGTLYLTNLTAGTTYYVRWMSAPSSAHSFNICIGTYPTPVNDECANAFELPVDGDLSCDSPTSGTTGGSTYVLSNSCFNSGDVWYSFTATQAAHHIVLSNVADTEYGNPQTVHVELLTGGCGNLASLRCWDNYFYSGGTLAIGDLTPGETYYLRIGSPSYLPINFDICALTPPPPPANDACSNAVVLTPEPGNSCTTTTSGTLENATSSPGLPYLCCNAGDVWYTFTATQADYIIALPSIINTQYNYPESVVLELYTSACGAFSLEGQTSVYSGGSWYLSHLTPGQTYHIRIYNQYPYYGPATDFEICVAAPALPSNDECANALPLPVNEDLTCSNVLFASTSGATQSQQALPCNGEPINDIWYQFTATTQSYRFDLNLINGTYGQWGYELLSGDCNNPVTLKCENLYYNQVITLYDLTAGETYYLRLFSAKNALHEITVCTRALPASPPNDDCTAATPLTVNPDLNCTYVTSGTTLGAGQSLANCFGEPNLDVWYSFVATGTTHLMELNVTNTYFDGYYTFAFQLLSGDCGDPAGYACTQVFGQNNFLLQNLTPGQTYYLRMLSFVNSAHDFTVCIKTLPPPPANDDCAAATGVMPNEGIVCDLIYPGTTASAAGQDVWFAFTATSNSHLIDIQNVVAIYGSPYYLYFDIYQGSDCNNLYLLSSYWAGNSPVLNTLFVPGQTYFIRMWTSDFNSAYTFDLCIKTLPPSPPNESCAGAFTLTPNAGLACDITTTGTTAGAINNDYYGCGYGNDVWYQFTATAPNHWIHAANITPVIGNGGFWLEVLQGADCSGLYSLYCTYFDQTIYMTGLTSGATYYVRVISEYGTAHNFDLCIQTLPPPPNDLCADAVSLDVSPDQTCEANTSGTTTGSGPTAGVSPCGFDGNDVWYSFTATQGSHTILINNVLDAQGGYASYFGVEVYGGACGALQNLACRSGLYFSDQFTVGDLTAGEVYYVRVFSYYFNGIDFNICVGTPPPPPANDACANAANLPVFPTETCETPTPGTLENATSSPVQPYYGYGVLLNDVWYTFTATQPNHIVTINSDPNSFLFMEVLSGNCGAFTTIASQFLYYNNQLLLTNLTPGATYYVRVYSYSNNPPAGFDICVTSILPPPNDECAGATPLPVNPDLTCQQSVTESSYGATQSLPGCNGEAVNDVWYQFVATDVSHRLDVSAYDPNNYSAAFGMEVYEGGCGNLVTLLPCTEYYYYPGNAVPVLQNLVPGNTYYIRLFSYQNVFQTFTVCVQTLPPPPANDECAQASAIQANSGLACDLTYSGTTLGATQSATSCYGNNTHDVWYQFEATSVSHLIDFQLTNTLLSPYGFLGIAVYSGSGCENLSSLQCIEYPPATPLTLSGLTVGDTYFIRVFSQYNSAHEFTLCIKTLPPPPANDNCADAQLVTPTEGLECTDPVAGSTSGVMEFSYFGCNAGPDLWYQFTATGNAYLIQLQDIVNQYGYSFLSLELYQGNNCESLSTVTCTYGGLQIYAQNLVAGATYYIRVVGAQNSGTDFNLCVLSIAPPANDECAGAVSLPVSPTAYCESVASGTTLGSSLSNVPGGCSVATDVWYSFVATDTAHTVNVTSVSGGNYYDLVYEVFSGSCGQLTSLGCYTPYTLAAFTGLIPGETYYVRIGTYGQNIFNFDLCVATALPDLTPVYLAVNSNGCGAGSNETVQAVFYNQSAMAIPAGASTFTLQVTGANNGNYGPVTNTEPIPPGLYNFVEFTGVDLSVPGFNVITITGTTVGDYNTANDQSSIFFTGLPIDTFYYDVDGDGYGNPDNFIVDCYQYEWLVTNSDDCNDYDFYVNPAASEFCNGYDDDCDGLTDADDPGVIDTIPPGIVCPPDTVLFNDPGQCSAIVLHAVVSAWDNCSYYDVGQTGGIASGEAFPVGVTTVTYQVTDVTNNTASCSFTVEVQKTADPDLLYAYTVIGFKDVTMKKNTVQSGGVGVVEANKKAVLQQGTTVTAPNTFVKAPVLQLQGGSLVTTYYQGQVASGLLPVFQPNNNPGNNNLTIANNNAPVVLNLNSYGKITVGNNVTVTFSGHNTVLVKELSLGNNTTVLFDQPTTVLIDKKMDVGQGVDINPGGGQAAQIFAEGNVTIDKGADITANIHTAKDLSLKKADAGNPTYMTGLFIADKVNAAENVYWNWDAAYCPAGQNRNAGNRPVEMREVTNALPGQIHLSPNPASEEVRISFNGEATGEATVQLFDAAGRLSRQEQFAVVMGANQYRLDLAGLPGGMYTVHISAGGQRVVEKLVIVK